jgi:hypothetical protein
VEGSDQRGVRRLPSFVLGSLIGASAVIATARQRRRIAQRRQRPAGLAAFEDAPCYRELEADRSVSRES